MNTDKANFFRLFRTLILRPLWRDRLRTLLTLAAMALGVAVVIGIELAGDAAAGSFQSSLATVAGKVDLQISANGGVDENWMGSLTALPFNARFSPVMERLATIDPGGVGTLYGVDLLGEPGIGVSEDLARRIGVAKGGAVRLR
jgi:putative ABC transport system permease protein